jgi:hypothetical protein
MPIGRSAAAVQRECRPAGLKPSRQFGLHATGNRHDFDYTRSGAFGCRADAGPTTMVKMPVQKIKMAVIAVAEFVDFPP